MNMIQAMVICTQMLLKDYFRKNETSKFQVILLQRL